MLACDGVQGGAGLPRAAPAPSLVTEVTLLLGTNTRSSTSIIPVLPATPPHDAAPVAAGRGGTIPTPRTPLQRMRGPRHHDVEPGNRVGGRRPLQCDGHHLRYRRVHQLEVAERNDACAAGPRRHLLVVREENGDSRRPRGAADGDGDEATASKVLTAVWAFVNLTCAEAAIDS